MRAAVLILASLVLAACSRHAETNGAAVTSLATPVPRTSSVPVIRIYEDTRNEHVIGLDAEDEPVVKDPVEKQEEKTPSAILVWADGRIVWRINGTSFEGQFDKTRLEELILRLDRDGAFDKERKSFSSFGPDSSYEVIEVHLPDRGLHFASWHDLYERNPEVVATDHGLTTIGGRDRKAVLAESSPEYQRFRRTWSDIRSSVESWVPANGTPITR